MWELWVQKAYNNWTQLKHWASLITKTNRKVEQHRFHRAICFPLNTSWWRLIRDGLRPQTPKNALVAPWPRQKGQKGKERKKQTQKFRSTNSLSRSKTSNGNWIAGSVRWNSRETVHYGNLGESGPCKGTNWEWGKWSKVDIIKRYRKGSKRSRRNCTAEAQWCRCRLKLQTDSRGMTVCRIWGVMATLTTIWIIDHQE